VGDDGVQAEQTEGDCADNNNPDRVETIPVGMTRTIGVPTQGRAAYEHGLPPALMSPSMRRQHRR
jgi:hypothetical protein